jgi:hypothetical protein
VGRRAIGSPKFRSTHGLPVTGVGGRQHQHTFRPEPLSEPTEFGDRLPEMLHNLPQSYGIIYRALGQFLYGGHDRNAEPASGLLCYWL